MFEFPYTCGAETKTYVDDCAIGRAVLRGPVTDYAGISTKKIQKQDNICFGFMGPYILKVVFNDPATIVFWSDNTKTVVKCGPDDIFDKEKGLALAICKKWLATIPGSIRSLNSGASQTGCTKLQLLLRRC